MFILEVMAASCFNDIWPLAPPGGFGLCLSSMADFLPELSPVFSPVVEFTILADTC